MLDLATLKRTVVSRLELRVIKKHRSRLGRHAAPRYTRYLDSCRAEFRGRGLAPRIEDLAREFERKGFTSFWTPENQRIAEAILGKIRKEDDEGRAIWDADGRYKHEVYTTFPKLEKLFQGALGSFLTAVYRAHFKIFYGILYKSERTEPVPTGSQLWHTDGGPGTCINVMFYLHDVTREDGAMECLPWDASLAIYRKELRSQAFQRRLRSVAASGGNERDVKCAFYLEEISRSYEERVEQPQGTAGLLVPFRNNILHKGGYPEQGRVRYACVFHCYPSLTPTPFPRYRQQGIPKVASYPTDPAADF
jgi:hypothetical protein